LNRRKSDHPGWGLARLVVIMVPLTMVLWLNSSNFDWTEFRSILQMGIVLGGIESVKLLKAKK
jgi:hypothetical protein